MTHANQSPSQRGKILLIPVLLLVLGYVIWDGNSMEGAGTGELSLKVPPEDTLPNPSAATAPKLRSWPAAELKTILAHDPFQPIAPPAEPPQPLPADRESAKPDDKTVPPKPPQLKVQAILDGPQGAGALIGGKLVRVGDTIEGGWRVVRIDASGVYVKPTAESPGEEK